VPTTESRPPLTDRLSAEEFLRWYWLRAELAAFARMLGLGAGGPKTELTDRIAARLAGRSVPVAVRHRRRPGRLPEPLTSATVIPTDQPCTQPVRQWLVDAVGPSFRFDAAMREFFASADGLHTLGDAVTHWHRTRQQARRAIDPQFELNRFTRRWHLDRPQGSRTELLADWAAYRALPVEHRGRA
jgi:SAP domain-containing new25/Domain of unknown function (DUF6434)